MKWTPRACRCLRDGFSCLEMIASGPISSEALLNFFPPPCCASGSNSFPGSHLVVTTYVLKRAIRHLMYGVFNGWPHWCSEPFVEMQRLLPPAGSTACQPQLSTGLLGVYEPSWGTLATRGEDWASQGQPKGKAEIPDRKSTRLNSSHTLASRMPSSA